MSFLAPLHPEQLTKDNEEDLLKKALYQQGKCLLIYPEGSNTSLLTALAETIRTNDETLHQKLSERLESDLKNFVIRQLMQTLPRRLSYIYEDPSIVEDFKKYPQLVNFVKIILELFSTSTERRINVYFLSYSGEITYNLSCKVINEGGYTEAISIARINNKYYNIQQREVSSKHELSLEDVFKSSPHIDSEELAETFKPDNNLLPSQKEEKSYQFPVEEAKSSGRPSEDLEEPDLMLKRAKSSMPFQQRDEKQDKGLSLDYEKGSKIQTLSLREETQLISQCGLGHENFEGYHGNMGVLSPEQMYYMYYQNPYYQPKNDNYLNYSSMPMHSMSPSKLNSYKSSPNSSQPIPNYYAAGYGQNAPSATAECSQNKRYTGRLKFFDEAKNYGFIIMDSDESDIFVHYDDLQKAGITKEVIKSFKNEMYMQIRFNFKVMEYFGKYKKSRKAVELVIIDDDLSLLGSGYPLPE